MLKPDLRPDEDQRLRCLRSLQILDTPPDPALDAITDLVSEQLDCPIALLSLVDDRRQWFKSRHGLSVAETPRDLAFCAHAILQHEQFQVPDAHVDARFADNPLVTGEPRVRFYAGQPLLVQGHAIGTLCVIDHVARELTPAQSRLLARMATVAESLLEAQWQGRHSALAAARLQDLASAASSNLLWECDAALNLTWVGDADGGALPGLAAPGQPLWDGNPLDELGRPQPGGLGLHAALRAATGPVAGAWEVATPDGPKTVGIRAVPVVGRGRQHIGWRGFARDVGPTVAKRRRLQAAEEASTSRRQQMAFLGRVSHELRTPLNAMLSFNHLLREELVDSLAPHQRRWMELVRQGGQHLLSLTDDILVLARNDECALVTTAMHLGPLVAESISFVGALARDAQVAVQATHTTPASLPPALADERALRQVLLNVLGNAIKYSPVGGRVRVQLAADDAHVLLDVTDQGPGIPAERLGLLFQPFERLGAEQGHVPGSGLGLAIAKSLVEAMNGRISAESPPEGGCRIRIGLPLAPTTAVTTTATH